MAFTVVAALHDACSFSVDGGFHRRKIFERLAHLEALASTGIARLGHVLRATSFWSSSDFF